MRPSRPAKAKGSDREAWFLVFSQAAAAWPVGFLTVVLPIYLKKVGIEPFWIGSFFTLSGLLSSGILILLGPKFDRLKRRPFLLLGTAAPLLGFLLLALVPQTWSIVMVSIIGGFGITGGLAGALVGATYNPFLVEKSGVERSTRFLSYMTSWWLLAVTIGSLCGGLPDLLVNRGMDFLAAYRVGFLLCAFFVVLAAIFILPVKEGEGRVLKEPISFPRNHEARKLIRRFGLNQIFVGMGAGFVVQLLSLWFFLKFQASEMQISPWFAAASFIATLGVYLVPRMTEIRGKVVATAVMQVLSALAVLAMPFVGHYIAAAVFYLVRTTLMNMSWPAQNAFLLTSVPRELRSSAVSVSNAAFGFFSSVTPLLGGLLIQEGYLDLPFFLGGLSFLASGLTFFFFFRRSEKLERQ